MSAPLAAAVMGSAAGLFVFAVCAVLWRLGASHQAAATAQTALLLALGGIAFIGFTPRPTARMQRIRVPISRARPPAWFPHEPDLAPLIAACAGGPLLLGSAAAFLLFR